MLHIGTRASRNRARYARPVILIFGLTSVLLVLASVNRSGGPASGVRDVVEEFGRDYVFEIVPLVELLARAPGPRVDPAVVLRTD